VSVLRVSIKHTTQPGHPFMTLRVCVLQSSSAGTRSMWRDVAEWMRDSWPWSAAGQISQPLPLRLQPVDIGFDDVDDGDIIRTKLNFTADDDQQSTDQDELVSFNCSLNTIKYWPS